MMQILQHQADQALTTKGGISADDLGTFYEWAKVNHREQLADAIGKQVHAADISGYRTLAARYLATVPPSAAALQAAGVPVRRSSHKAGAVEVFISGAGNGWMSPTAASRAGLL